MPNLSTLGCTQIADLFAALECIGARPYSLAEDIGLPVPDPGDPFARVPSSSVVALLDAAARAQRDPLIGLHAGAHTIARGPLFFLLLSASRVSDGLRLIRRFAKLPVSELSMGVVAREGSVDLILDSGDPVIDASHHALDYMIGTTLSLLRRAIPGFRLLRVELAHPEIGPAGETERILGCPVRFARPHNVLRFPDETLDTVPAAASPLIAREMERFAESLLTSSRTEHFGERVTEVIHLLLACGEVPDEVAVAGRMHVSIRTMQRNLERDSLKFKDVRDRARLEVAQSLLSNPAVRIGAVADRVGFSDTSAFSKAFRRWAGVSPSSYRRELQGIGEPPAAKRRHRGVR